VYEPAICFLPFNRLGDDGMILLLFKVIFTTGQARAAQ
jgi:hypothetical protein